MYRLFAGAALALVMVVVTASAKEYKNATIVKADDDSITVKFEGSDKEVVVKLNDKTTFASVGKDGTEKEAKKEMLAKRLEFAKDKGITKTTIVTEGDDKEDPAKDKLVAKKVVTSGGRGGMGKGGKGKDTAKKDL